eukprot:1186226-Prorocentrum_minimum.AAC.2
MRPHLVALWIYWHAILLLFKVSTSGLNRRMEPYLRIHAAPHPDLFDSTRPINTSASASRCSPRESRPQRDTYQRLGPTYGAPTLGTPLQPPSNPPATLAPTGRPYNRSPYNMHYRSSARAHSNVHVPTAATPSVYTPLAPIRTPGHLQLLLPSCVHVRVSDQAASMHMGGTPPWHPPAPPLQAHYPVDDTTATCKDANVRTMTVAGGAGGWCWRLCTKIEGRELLRPPEGSGEQRRTIPVRRFRYRRSEQDLRQRSRGPQMWVESRLFGGRKVRQ